MITQVLIALLLYLTQVDTYSRGAPDTSCTDNMTPRHGFDVQAGPPPVMIYTDTEEMSHRDYLRVTLRADGQFFRGFLVKAVEVLNTDTQSYASSAPIGSWHIPFHTVPGVQSNISQYVACDGVHQRAVTHSDANKNLVSVVHLQWTPPYNYHGIVVITATVVQNYSTYWTNIRSHPISVSVGEQEQNHPQEAIVKQEPKDNQNSDEEVVNNDEDIIDYFHEFISIEQNKETTEKSSEVNQIPIENLYNIVTESITVGNLSFPKARSPRFENQELYEKMESNYGSWENGGDGSAVNYKMIVAVVMAFLVKM